MKPRYEVYYEFKSNKAWTFLASFDSKKQAKMFVKRHQIVRPDLLMKLDQYRIVKWTANIIV